MNNMEGFFYPRTATGRSSIIPTPPWYYSGDLLTIEYRTDPARVAELLPDRSSWPPTIRVRSALIWADWQSCSGTREELLDPVRSQYKEAFAVVRCSFQGAPTPAASSSGSTRTSPSPGGCIRAIPRSSAPCGRPAASVRPGRAADRGRGVFGATLAAGDRRLAQASCAARGVAPATGSSTATRWPIIGAAPASRRAAPDADLEPIASGACAFEAGLPWAGEAELRAVRPPTEEPDRLPVHELIGGYFRQVGVVWDGGTSLATLDPAAGGRPMNHQMSSTYAVVEGVEVDPRHWIGGRAGRFRRHLHRPLADRRAAPSPRSHAGTATEVDAAVEAGPGRVPGLGRAVGRRARRLLRAGRRRHRGPRSRTSSASRPGTTAR